MIRYDIESSAQYEQSLGVKGDYYFCTGAVRTLDPGTQQRVVDSLIRAVNLYGATIGSHNGGYPNPVDHGCQPVRLLALGAGYLARPHQRLPRAVQ